MTRLKYPGFIVLLALFVAGCSGYKAKPLTAVEFKAMIDKNPDVQIVDVRTFNEFYTGHLANAINIDFYNPGFRAGLDTLDRNKPIGVYCLVGQRSAEAYKMLVDMKFKEVYHLTAGTVAWQREKYPIEEGAGGYKRKQINTNQ